MQTKLSASRCFHQQHLKNCKNPNGTEFIMTTALAAPLAYNSNLICDPILPTININLKNRRWTAYVDTGATINLVTQSIVMYLDLPKTKTSRQIQITGVGGSEILLTTKYMTKIYIQGIGFQCYVVNDIGDAIPPTNTPLSEWV